MGKILDKLDKNVRPERTTIKEGSCPEELQKLPYWGIWAWHWDKKWTKPPVDNLLNRSSFNDFNMTYKQALKACKKHGADGIGFHFHKNSDVIGIDFDDVLDKDGKITCKKTRKIVQDLKKKGCYIERSPSGVGLHGIGLGASKLNGVDKTPIYAGSRYFTWTGDGSGPFVDISKAVNKHFSVKKKIKHTATTGNKESLVGMRELSDIIKNIRPDLSEPEWFIVCKAINKKTDGSEAGFQLFMEWSTGAFCKKSMKYDWKKTGETKEEWKEGIVQKWNRCSPNKENGVGLPKLREVEALYPVGGKERIRIADILGKKEKKEESEILQEKEYTSHLLTAKHLPKIIREAAEEVSRFTKVSIDVVVTTMLMVASASISDQVIIHEKDGLSFKCSMAAFMGLPSGGRKSAVDYPLMRAFKKHESRLCKEWDDAKVKNAMEVKILKKDLKEIEATEEISPDKKVEEMTVIQDRINELSQQRPRLTVADVTEEMLSEIMDRNNQKTFVQSDEGRNVCKNIAGRYDSGGSENIYISALTGSEYRRDRLKDNTQIHLSSPCMNMCVKVQLDLLREMVENDKLRESGLLARTFLKVNSDDISEQYKEEKNEREFQYNKMRAYDDTITTILDYVGKVVDVRLSPEAKEARRLFANHYSELIKGSWKDQRDVTNKIVTQSVKMATVYALLKAPTKLTEGSGKMGIKGFSISRKDYEAGRDIVLLLMNQTLEAMGTMDYNNLTIWAKKVIERLKERRKKERANGKKRDDIYFTMGSIQNMFSSSKRKEVPRYVETLCEEGLLIQDDKRYYIA